MRSFAVGILSVLLLPGKILRCLPWGKLAMLAREACLRSRLKALGSPAWFQRDVEIVAPEAISIGRGCTFERFVTLSSGAAGAGIRIGDGVHIRYGSVLYTGGGAQGGIEIGDATLINYRTSILGDGGVRIGRHVLISPGVVITSFQHGFADTARPIVEQSPKLAPVVIEDDVYLGSNVVVCPGVKIGRGAVIGAGAVVTKDIPSNSVAMGVPAEVRRSR